MPVRAPVAEGWRTLSVASLTRCGVRLARAGERSSGNRQEATARTADSCSDSESSRHCLGVRGLEARLVSLFPGGPEDCRRALSP
eukprot:2344542-Pyramimonas_sp.AAC.1